MQRFHSASFLLYVFQCLQTFLLFSDRLNWKNNNTSNHEFSLQMSTWPCHEIHSGQVLYFGAREHLFVYSFIIILLKYVAANAFGIWNSRNTGKSVTNWVTHMLHQIDGDSATCITYSTDYYRNWIVANSYQRRTKNLLTRSSKTNYERTTGERTIWLTIDDCLTVTIDGSNDYRTGCRNVSHCQQQQSCSGLRSPGRSYSTYLLGVIGA